MKKRVIMAVSTHGRGRRGRPQRDDHGGHGHDTPLQADAQRRPPPGRGVQLTGHHEVMLPLLHQLLFDRM